jgi:segregation and condensation protein A
VNTAFRLDLPVFAGPLDLLLHLVRRDDIDLADLPVAAVAEQYLAYLDAMPKLDLDVAGDWLVTAAWLIWLKSRALLPRADDEEGPEDDPRAELLARLADYEKVKAAAAVLDERPRLGRDSWAVSVETPTGDSAPRPWAPVGVEDLVAAVLRVLARLPDGAVDSSLQFIAPSWTVEQGAALLARGLAATGRAELIELLASAGERGRAVVVFLAMLELVRLGELALLGEGDQWVLRVARPLTDLGSWVDMVQGSYGPDEDDRAR